MELSLEELQWIEAALTWSEPDCKAVSNGWSNLVTRVRDQLSLANAERSRQAATWTPDTNDIALAIFTELTPEFGWVGNTLERFSERAAEIVCREVEKQALADGFVRVRADDLDRQICMTPVTALVTQEDHDVEQRLCHALATVKPRTTLRGSSGANNQRSDHGRPAKV